MTPSRALWTSGVLVKTFEPGMAGIAQDATGFGDRSTWYQWLRILGEEGLVEQVSEESVDRSGYAARLKRASGNGDQ